jgi:hypothetical protein
MVGSVEDLHLLAPEHPRPGSVYPANKEEHRRPEPRSRAAARQRERQHPVYERLHQPLRRRQGGLRRGDQEEGDVSIPVKRDAQGEEYDECPLRLGGGYP